MLLPPVSGAEAWTEEGYVELTDVSSDGRGGRRLLLRVLCTAPGHSVLHELYQSHIVDVSDAAICVRGIERVRTPAGEAAVVQEWLIKPTRVG